MKLYMVPGAPNPTKVMLYIAEREVLGADLGVEHVMVNVLKGAQRSDEHLARNPFGTLPVLELDNGDYLIESLAIIQYLEDKVPAHRLMPEDVDARALVRDLERTIEFRIASPLNNYVHAVNSPLGLEPSPTQAAQLEERMRPAFAYVDTQLGDGRAWLAGDEVSIADCTLQCALQFARFREVPLPGDYANITSWDERYRARPAAQSVLKF